MPNEPPQLEESAADSPFPNGTRARSEAQSAVYLDIKTTAVGRLVTGRASAKSKPAILGLFGFADRLREIWEEAGKGDPYARWWLLKVEQSIADCQAHLNRERAAVAKQLAKGQPLGIDPAARRIVVRISLKFACPYAYWGARVVGDLDQLIVALDLALQLGIETKSTLNTIRRTAERAVRRCFCSAQGFVAFGLTDVAVDDGQALSLDASAVLDKLPLTVRTGEDWPALLDRPDPQDTLGP